MSESQTKVSVYQHGKLLCENVLPAGDYVIGPDGVAEQCVSGKTVGGPKLHLNGEEWLVEDDGNMGATIVDGETITVPMIILRGQVIHHGDREIVLDSNAPVDPVAAEVRPEVVVRQPSPEEIRNSVRYGVTRKVGRGGMGVVMSARDVILQREVAMKLMLDGTKPESVARFYQEAQITAQLEHPNIVPVHELDLNDKNQPFYTMKLVRGTSLKVVLEGLANEDRVTLLKWPLPALLTVFQKVCDAIAFAHARGVIHRDLKPDNIMLGEYGEVQVMDWGLAKLLGQDSATGHHQPVTPADSLPVAKDGKTTVGATMSGTVIGTPQYMSPEQANGAVELMDERTDLYSLGAILYHILALHGPFKGHNTEEVLRNVRAGQIAPMWEAGAEKRLAHLPGGRIPDSLAAVSRKAMALQKTQRYPAVKILQAEIQAYQNGFATSAEDAGIWKLASLFFRRHRTVSLAAATLLIAGIVFAINLKRERDRATNASSQADAARQVADKQRNAAEDQLYLSEMLQAGRHLADGRPESARDLLSRHRKERSRRDLRGWEWFYLLGEANQDRLRVHAHSGGVFAVAATANGARIATGGGDGDVAVWRSRGLVPEFRLHASESTVLAVDWHVGGRLLAAGCADGLVCVWDAETRQSVAKYRLDTEGEVRSVRWRPDAAGAPTLFFGGTDKEIYSWRPLAAGKAGEPKAVLSTPAGVSSLHWSNDGVLLAAGELDSAHPVEVFDVDLGLKPISDNVGSGNDAFSIAIDPTSNYVAAGSKHLTTVIYDLGTGKKRSVETLHRNIVSALAWSPDRRRLASASHDGTIRLFTPDWLANEEYEKGPGLILSGHRGAVNALVWVELAALAGASEETNVLISGGADGTLRAWSPHSTRVFSPKGKNWISAANWNPDGTRIAIANFQDDIHLCDPTTGRSVPIPTAHGNVFDVVWSPNGDRLATASRGANCVETFDAGSGRPLGNYLLEKAYRVAWSPTGKYLAAGGPEGVRVWDTKSGALLVVISRPVGCVLWHPDEHRIVLGGGDGAIELWDAFAGKLLATWRAAATEPDIIVNSSTEPPHQVFDLRWSGDGRFLAYTTQDGAAGLLNGRDGQFVRSFSEHSSGVWRVVWNPDDSRLATVGQGGILRVFDAATGGAVAHIEHGLGNSELHALDWSRDGRRLMSGGFDGAVRLWDARRGEQIDAVDQLPADEHPDLETLRSRFRVYAQLGWAGLARETLHRAQALDPDDPALNADAQEAEAFFARVLEPESSDISSTPSQSRRATGLLNTIYDAWKSGKAVAAREAWLELARQPASSESLALARTYLTRAKWLVKWFPSKVDPIQEPERWRMQANGENVAEVNVKALSFPFLHRAPKDLDLGSDLAERRSFGMIAEAKVTLAAGKWRCRTIGGDGARVLVDDRSVLENWSADAPVEKSGDFEQLSTGAVKITVEHFVREGTDGFQFLLEPVAE